IMKHRGVILRSALVIFLIGLLLCSNSVILNNEPGANGLGESYESAYKPDDQLEYEPGEIQVEVRAGTRSTVRVWTVDTAIDGIDASNITLDQLYPTVTSDNDRTIYCAWQDIRTGDWDIYLSKSTNFGLNWDDDQLVTNATTSDGHQQYPAIVFGSMTEPVLYLVWQDMRNDDGDIYFSYSIDNGDTWANEVQVNKESSAITPPRQWYPAIATDNNGGIYVAWADDSNGNWDILMSTSTNKGITWSESVLVNDAASGVRKFNQTKPSIGVDDRGVIYVAWEDSRDSEKQIYCTRSKDGGKTFSNDVTVSTWKLDTNYKNPEMKVHGNGNIYLVWEEDYFSKFNVYFSKSLDSGVSFSSPIQVNNVSNKCSPDASPDVEVDNKGDIFISWSDQRDKNHIYMGYSIDNGNTFQVNEVVDDADDTPATPISVTTQEELERGQQTLTIMKNKIYVVWTDYRNDPNPDNAVSENGDLYIDWNGTPPNREPLKINFDEDNTTKGWDHINLSWPVSKDLDFSKYLVYKSTVDDFEPELLYLNATIDDRTRNYIKITNLSSSTTYYFFLVVEDLGGLTNKSDRFIVSTNSNIPPVINLIEPDGKFDLVDSSYEISWLDSDPDDNATIRLYYDTNQIPTDGRTLITVVPHGEDSLMDFYLWDTRAVPNGSYFISAIISDQVNGDQPPRYSSGKVTIFHGNLDPLIILFKTPMNISNVGLTEAVAVRFNKNIDMTSISSNSFYVLDSAGSKVDGEFSYNSSSNKLKFSPTDRWNGTEKYNVHLTTSITDSSGLFRLGAKHTWWFETEEYIIPKATIFGEVVEAYNHENRDPIAGVTITVTDKKNKSNVLTTTTDSSGRFILTVVYGDYELVAQKESYQDPGKIQISANKTNIDVIIELVRPAILDINIQGKITADEE
ncbi:MAG: exo-alpha-sialidase, partial [Thermoplasmata archaeon]|nr:exo-alpha-sialidase [Thermoplasmata archaeon]